MSKHRESRRTFGVKETLKRILVVCAYGGWGTQDQLAEGDKDQSLEDAAACPRGPISQELTLCLTAHLKLTFSLIH